MIDLRDRYGLLCQVDETTGLVVHKYKKLTTYLVLDVGEEITFNRDGIVRRVSRTTDGFKAG